MTRVSRRPEVPALIKREKKERCLYLLSVTAASPQALGLFEDIVTEPNKMTQVALKRW